MRWRGRDGKYHEQVANACDDFADLTPASQAPAETVLGNWSALLPGQDVPLIWERTNGGCQEDDGCPREDC
jgi:hypothetical protein